MNKLEALLERYAELSRQQNGVAQQSKEAQDEYQRLAKRQQSIQNDLDNISRDLLREAKTYGGPQSGKTDSRTDEAKSTKRSQRDKK